MHIVAVPASATHDLRRRVLRRDDPAAPVTWPGDDDPSTVHLAVLDDGGATVGVSTWLHRGDEVQLRGMATEPSLAGTGIGTMLLDHAAERAAAAGATRVWANARVTAVGFYTRYGFTVEGPEFVTSDTGLAHRRVTLPLR